MWTAAKFIALAVVFAVLAIISTSFRFWARAQSKAKLGADDVFILLALLGVLAIAATMIAGAELGEMGQHQTTVMGPNGPVFTDTNKAYEICNYIIQLVSYFSLGCSKVSVLFLYRRIFHIHSLFLKINTVLMVLIVIWSVSFFFATAFQCQKPSIIWSVFEFQRVDCVDTIPFYYAGSISGFITDLLILVSPLPLIFKLQLSWGKRIAVACILQLGLLVFIAGIVRFVTFIRIGQGIAQHFNDITYFTIPVFIWTMIESGLAVVAANLPLLRPVLAQSIISWDTLRSWTSPFSTRGQSTYNSRQDATRRSSVSHLHGSRDDCSREEVELESRTSHTDSQK